MMRIDYDVLAFANLALDEINEIDSFIKNVSANNIRNRTTNASAQQSKLYN